MPPPSSPSWLLSPWPSLPLLELEEVELDEELLLEEDELLELEEEELLLALEAGGSCGGVPGIQSSLSSSSVHTGGAPSVPPPSSPLEELLVEVVEDELLELEEDELLELEAEEELVELALELLLEVDSSPGCPLPAGSSNICAWKLTAWPSTVPSTITVTALSSST